MSSARLPFAVLLLCAISQSGCISSDALSEPILLVEDRSSPASFAGGELGDTVSVPRGWSEDTADGVILGPESVEVFVGDALELDVTLADPALGTLTSGGLPAAAVVSTLPSGLHVSWTPLHGDIGEHELLFLVIDSGDGLVIAQESILVDVLGRHSLVEYGF